jgi:hypothetical protein
MRLAAMPSCTRNPADGQLFREVRANQDAERNRGDHDGMDVAALDMDGGAGRGRDTDHEVAQTRVSNAVFPLMSRPSAVRVGDE